MSLSTADFQMIATLVRRHAGVALNPERDFAIEARLSTLARASGLTSVQALLARMRDGSDDTLGREVVESLINHETLFFRDMHPFEFLRLDIIPQLMDQKKNERVLNIWSAACSSGQEPYSIAMLLLHHFPSLRDWRLHVLATDCSPTILQRAKDAEFTQVEVSRGLPEVYLAKYFDKVGLRWVLKDDIRRLVVFQEANLAYRLPSMATPDIVFLRNVLLYFDVDTKQQVISHVESVLAPTSYVFLGSSETTLGLRTQLVRCSERVACYKLGGKPRRP